MKLHFISARPVSAREIEILTREGTLLERPLADELTDREKEPERWRKAVHGRTLTEIRQRDGEFYEFLMLAEN